MTAAKPTYFLLGKDRELIEHIVERAAAIHNRPSPGGRRSLLTAQNRWQWVLDIRDVHGLHYELDLEALLKAPEPEFMNDVWSIPRYLNRETGLLRNNFRPRYTIRSLHDPVVPPGAGPVGRSPAAQERIPARPIHGDLPQRNISQTLGAVDRGWERGTRPAREVEGG